MAIGEISEQKDKFYITFVVNEGERYKFGNINVDGVGIIKHGMFLNEQRIFGICTPETDDN